MRRIFADTFYWLALASPSDQWHTAALEAIARLSEIEIVTTEEVLTEFLAGMAGRGRYQRDLAIQMVRHILSDETTIVLPQTHDSFVEGLSLYEHRTDKQYSLTDCISMNACRNMGIGDILTNDHHFVQEGFVALVTR